MTHQDGTDTASQPHTATLWQKVSCSVFIGKHWGQCQVTNLSTLRSSPGPECQSVIPWVLVKSSTVISSSPLMVLLSPGVGVAATGLDNKLIQNLLPNLRKISIMAIFKTQSILLWAHPWHSGCLVMALRIILNWSAVYLCRTFPSLLVMMVRVRFVSFPHQLIVTGFSSPSSFCVFWLYSWLC